MNRLARLDPKQLYVQYRGVTPTEPILPRRYTLTHSDQTAELFSVIGTEYAYDKTNEMRDEVLAEWRRFQNEGYVMHAYVYVGDYGPALTAIRYNIFKRELPLALEGIIYGDRFLYERYPELLSAPIYVFFDSTYPQYSGVEYYGTPSDYL